jgi:probable addiction module antidote protein
MDRLSRPSAAASFLNAARADSLDMFLVALRKVAQAHQMSRVAREANIQRESLYRALSPEGNPTIVTLSSVLEVLGLDFIVSAKKKPIESDPGNPQHTLPEDSNAGLSGRVKEVTDIGAFKALAGTAKLIKNLEGQAHGTDDNFAGESTRNDGTGCTDERREDPTFGLRTAVGGAL